MGFLSLIAHCGACGQSFGANPAYVPSLRLDDGRERRGLPPIFVHPLAYEPQEG
jgi:hypothetical protein